MNLYWTLFDSILKSSLLLGVAAVAARSARKNPTLQRLVWVIAFVAVPLALGMSLFAPATMRLVSVATPAAMPFAFEEAPFASEIPTALMVWLLGVVAVLGYGAGCFRSLIRLRSKSDLVLQLKGIDLDLLSEQAGMCRAWELRVSRVAIPPSALTWGWRKPVVLLPRDAMAWDTVRVRTVLLHELAHVRKADSAVQLLVLLVCAGLWFNPLVWLCARAFRAAAEAAADEAVLLAGVRPSEYASVLLLLAAELKDRPQPDMAFGASILGRSGIENRIRAIVSHPPRHVSNRRAGTFTFVIALLLVCGTGSFQVAAAVPQDIPALPDMFKGKSKEWIDGFLSAKRHTKGPGAPNLRTNEREKYEIEKRLRAAYEIEQSLNGL